MPATEVFSQTNCEVPLPPVLTSASINSATGFTELRWTLSQSPSIAAYIIYNHTSGYGIPIDTIWDPTATSYSFYSAGIKYFAESFVVASFRKPICTSPLSNILSTIYCTVTLDTCQKKIGLKWNRYSDYPSKVTGYEISIRKNGDLTGEKINVPAGSDAWTITDFETRVQYCFSLKALLENGQFSQSNSSCLTTKMTRAPGWINADFASVIGKGNILVSFTIDPLSELKTFILERKRGISGSFEKLSQFQSITGALLYADQNIEEGYQYFYRLAAVNKCDIPVIYSNTASNIVLSLDQNGTDVILSWNGYRKWAGSIDRYELYMASGADFDKMENILPSDTTITIPYSSLMYKALGTNVCFMVKAFENGNPYGISGKSQSDIKCIPPTEVITVPNAFTPDNDQVNDRFRPVLSFTPLTYRFVITDMKRKVVFEAADPGMEWDGTSNGTMQPEGVYLWQLKLVPPSGSTITRSGTVTIIRLH